MHPDHITCCRLQLILIELVSPVFNLSVPVLYNIHSSLLRSPFCAGQLSLTSNYIFFHLHTLFFVLLYNDQAKHAHKNTFIVYHNFEITDDFFIHTEIAALAFDACTGILSIPSIFQ